MTELAIDRTVRFCAFCAMLLRSRMSAEGRDGESGSCVCGGGGREVEEDMDAAEVAEAEGDMGAEAKVDL